MSDDIEERVVEMKFNNAAFENNVGKTLGTLDKLKSALKLDGAKKSLSDLNTTGKKFSLANIADTVGGIASKLSTMGIVGITALTNIANRAVDTGLSLAKSLTLDPIMDGFREYETQINAVQTILANTASKGINLSQVNGALNELNKYADKTIYNFTEMTRNIGTFTAAGVGLNTSVQAIKGISNLAAVSGSNAQQASTAMYQLSQALASGTVKLQDWNSVVNAGMGGQVFQDALKETARVHGVKIDEMIKKEGSFRETLKNGWLTSKILTETLSKFTGDLSEEQLKSMGYSKKQIADIIKLGKMSNDAATKVKTFSQLIDTLREAVGSGWSQTWLTLFGDFEEAKKMYTNVSNVLGKLIGDSSDARNNLLKDWKTMGGRSLVIKSITNLFKNFMTIARAVGKAFSDIFPAMTAQQLYDFTAKFWWFTQNLKLGKKDLENFKKTFRGVFAIFSIAGQIIGKVVSLIFDLIGSMSGGGSSFLDFTGKIGDWLVQLDKALKDGEGLTKFFDGLKTAIKVPLDLLMSFGKLLGNAFSGLSGDGISQFGVDVGNALNPVKVLAGSISDAWGRAVEAVSGAVRFMQPLIDKVGQAFQWLADKISDAMSNFDVGNIGNIFNAAVFGSILLGIRKFIKGANGGLGDLKGIVGTVKETFEGVSGVLEAMQQNLKAGTLLKIAGALALMTASIVALSMIDPVSLGKAMIAIQIMFAQLNGAMQAFGKVAGGKGMLKMPLVTTSLILLGIAINILAAAVARLSGLDWAGLAKGLIGVGGLLAALSLFVKFTETSKSGVIQAVGLVILATAIKILASAVGDLGQMDVGSLVKGVAAIGALLGILAGFSNLTKNAKGMITTAVGITIIGVALNILALAVGKLGGMDLGSLAKGIGAITVLLAVIAGFAKLTNNAKGMISTAAGLVILGAALRILADVIGILGGMDLGSLVKGIVGMGGALVIIAGAMRIMPKGMVAQAIGLIIVAQALVIIAGALQTMGGMSWEEIAKGMVGLAGALIIIAGAMMLMTEALPGAAALLVVAASLAILAPVLQMFASMSWEEIAKGLVMLAGVFLVLGLAGLALTPVIPSLLGLGAAILLLGLGALAAGAGLLMFSAGLLALSAAGAVGIGVLVATVTAIANLIPLIIVKIGEGLIALIVLIGNSAKAIVDAFVKILLALIEAVPKVIPALIKAVVALIKALVNALVELIPFLVEAGFKLLMGLLNGIKNNVGKVVSTATDIIVKFIAAIGKSANRIADAGADMIIDFVRGLAKTINKKSGEMREAGVDLAKAIINGMTGGLWDGVSDVINAAAGVAERALRAAEKALGINSPSKEFFKLGVFSDKGLALGITRFGYLAYRAGRNVGESVIDTVRNSLQDLNKVVTGEIDVNPTITPVLDLSAIKKDSSLISDTLAGQTVKMDKAYAMASSISADQASYDRSANESPEVTKIIDVKLEQKNYSPETLPAATIYRNTNSQLAQLKGILGLS